MRPTLPAVAPRIRSTRRAQSADSRVSPVSTSTRYIWNTRSAISSPYVVAFISGPPSLKWFVGKGIEEIRIWDDSGIYRVICTATLSDAVYVLHAFQNRTDDRHASTWDAPVDTATAIGRKVHFELEVVSQASSRDQSISVRHRQNVAAREEHNGGRLMNAAPPGRTASSGRASNPGGADPGMKIPIEALVTGTDGLRLEQAPASGVPLNCAAAESRC